MSDQKFADTHNLVAFLEKPTESEGFEEIVDFLNANPIKYALTVNLIIYCSCIKQFWDTVKAKTVNGEVQLQALVDKKKLTLMGNIKREGKGFSGRVTPLFQTMMVQAHEEVCKGSKIPTDPHHTPIIQPSTSQPQKKQSRRKQRKDTEIPQSNGLTEHIADKVANEENVPTQSNDPPLSRVNTLGSGEDRLSLKELMDLCTKLSNRVLDLETTKTAQAKDIASLKKRIKKLERKRKLKTSGMKTLFKIGRSTQVVSSEDEGLGDQEDASKQGRKIADIDADAEEVEVEKVASTAEITTEEITLAQALAELRSVKPKVVVQEPVQSTTTTTPSAIPRAKGIVFHEQEQAPTPIVSSQQPTQIKDKGKGKMVEEPMKKISKKELLKLDEELAFKLQAEEEEQARLAREKAEKQEELTDEEKEKLFVELLEKRKKHFAALRAQEKRNKPPTKAQKKSTMSTYLKHMAGYKQSQLKNKSFAEIQKLFDKAMTRVNMFVDKDTELVKESLKKAKAEMAEESSSKREGDELEQEPTKKQKVDDDKEREDLQQ
ncbi:hypothetical protein Tco_0328262 [Tanacetum coccineum]